MRSIGKALAGICGILFVISGVIALLSFNIEQKVFSPETYKQAFENQNLYERMPQVLAATISTTATGDAGNLLGMLSTERNFASLFPPSELRTFTDNVLDSTFAYLNRESDSAVVSLVSLKGYIVSEGGVLTVTQLLDSQPPCTMEQIAQITIGLISGQSLLLCDPPDEIMGLVTPLIQSQLQSVVNTLPNEVVIISGEASNTSTDPRLRLDRIRALMKLTLVVPFFFLAVIVIFAVRSIKEWLNWWGWPFLLTGAAGLFVSWVGSPMFEFLLGRGMQAQGSDLVPLVLLATLQDAAGEIARQILNPVVVEGVGLFLLGLTMIIIASLLTRMERLNV